MNEPKEIMNHPLRKILACIFLVLLIDLSIGMSCALLKYVSNGSLYYKLFDFSEEHSASGVGTRENYELFRANYFDALTGWNNPITKHLRSRGCTGEWEAHYSEDGSRRSCETDPAPHYDVICVGDSFTHGNEVDDCSSYPAELERVLNVRVANFGVGGFDAVQSVLQYEKVLAGTSAPKVGVLGIMYENGRRNLNSFRPVYTNAEDAYEYFLLKPYYARGKLVCDHLLQENSFDSFRMNSEIAFQNDYWSKPGLRFPFTLSLARALSSNSFRFLFHQKMNKLLSSPMYAYDFRDKDVLDGLRFVVNKFVRDSDSHGVRPVILFIPPNTLDLSSPDALIAELEREYPQAVFLNFGREIAPGGEFVAGEGCHPTKVGYKSIAASVGRAILESNVMQ